MYNKSITRISIILIIIIIGITSLSVFTQNYQGDIVPMQKQKIISQKYIPYEFRFVNSSVLNNISLCKENIPIRSDNTDDNIIIQGKFCIYIVNMTNSNHTNIVSFRVTNNLNKNDNIVKDWKSISAGYLDNIDDYKLRETKMILWSTNGIKSNMNYDVAIAYKNNNMTNNINIRIANGIADYGYKSIVNCISLSGKLIDLSNSNTINNLEKCGI